MRQLSSGCSLLAVSVFLVAGCETLPENLVQSPDVELRDLQVVGMGFKSQTFLLSFAAKNPNAFPLPVRGVSYGLKLDGQRFASGETISNFTVPADGEADFAISVDLNLLQTAPQLLSIVRDGARQDLVYEIEGQFAVDIPFAPAVKYHNSGNIRLNGPSY